MTCGKSLSDRLLRRHRLLDAARGLVHPLQPAKDESSGTTGPAVTAASTSSTTATLPYRNQSIQSTPPLKCFRLERRHVGFLTQQTHSFLQEFAIDPPTPTEFHSKLCELIQNAKERVYLASLYIGAGDHQKHQEQQLLQALSQVPAHVNVKIVMDKNRALRKIPLDDTENQQNSDQAMSDALRKTTSSSASSFTSSAQAVAKAIHLQANHQLFLVQVLNPPYDSILPNPLDEVAGVFHIKAYVIDDCLIISGANLSEEYFRDRQDRYWLIQRGGNGLVDFYAQFIEILSRHGEEYTLATSTTTTTAASTTTMMTRSTHLSTTRQEFSNQLTDLFTDPTPETAETLLPDDYNNNNTYTDSDVVAVCIPTFQPPDGFFSAATMPHLATDAQATFQMLEAARILSPAKSISNHTSSAATTTATTVQLSSAYLNPTHDWIQMLAQFQHVELLTAGRVSHGFRPKPNKANKGKDWIPTVFEYLAQDICQRLPHARLWYWERPGWTFHSKGLWLSDQYKIDGNHENNNNDSKNYNNHWNELVAAMVGSGNYGERSYQRDMESNCILIFPPGGNNNNDTKNKNKKNILQTMFQSEWQAKQASSRLITNPTPSSTLPFHIQLLYPFIKSFF